MLIPTYIQESDCIAMNEAARDYAWSYYNKGVLMAVEALRAGIADGYTPLHHELVALCDTLQSKTKEARAESIRVEMAPAFETPHNVIKKAINQISRTLPKGYEIHVDVDGNYSVERKA